MANLVPASNVQYAAVAAFVAGMVEHLCAANNIVIPPDIADALPGVIAIAVAHISDLMTGQNVKTDPKP